MATTNTDPQRRDWLLGVAGAQLPTKSDKKIARVEIGIEATLRPTAGAVEPGALFIALEGRGVDDQQDAGV